MTLLTIAHIGAFMATVFRFLYRNVFCGVCCALCRRRRRDNHTTDGDVETAADNVVPRSTAHDRAAAIKRTAAQRVRESYRVIVEWRRGITNALYTEDYLMEVYSHITILPYALSSSVPHPLFPVFGCKMACCSRTLNIHLLACLSGAASQMLSTPKTKCEVQNHMTILHALCSFLFCPPRSLCFSLCKLTRCPRTLNIHLLACRGCAALRMLSTPKTICRSTCRSTLASRHHHHHHLCLPISPFHSFCG